MKKIFLPSEAEILSRVIKTLSSHKHTRAETKALENYFCKTIAKHQEPLSPKQLTRLLQQSIRSTPESKPHSLDLWKVVMEVHLEDIAPSLVDCPHLARKVVDCLKTLRRQRLRYS